MDVKRSLLLRSSITSQRTDDISDDLSDADYDYGYESSVLSIKPVSRPIQVSNDASLSPRRLSIDWNDSVDRSGMAELCQYAQHLETEKKDLLAQVHFLQEQDGKLQMKLKTSIQRIEGLEVALKTAEASRSIWQDEKQAMLALQTAETERVTGLAALLHEAQKKYDEAEKARQQAVFRLSAMQATLTETTTQQLLSESSSTLLGKSNVASFDTSVNFTLGEHIEKYKREIELLRQQLELKDEHAIEKQKRALDLEIRSLQLEHASAIEKVKLECEIRLSEWRHEEAVRAKEMECAMEEDRYSIRLEMKHATQRAQIDQRVSFLQAQSALAAQQSSLGCHHHYGESDFSFGTLDEVLVRMQKDQLRTRRFEALKKSLLIRNAKLEKVMKAFLCRWKIQISTEKILQLNAVLHMHRIVSHLKRRQKRAFFNEWKAQIKLSQVHAFQSQALSCWNRMLAVERINHVLQQYAVKRSALYFHHWRVQTMLTSGAILENMGDASGGDGNNNTIVTGSDDVRALQQEIEKLHEQLASAKSEAWRYKRQLLKQFL